MLRTGATRRPIESRKISYSWDSVLEQAGLDGYRLDCFVWRDGCEVDYHESFRTRAELYAAIEDMVPLLENVTGVSDPTQVLPLDEGGYPLGASASA